MQPVWNVLALSRLPPNRMSMGRMSSGFPVRIASAKGISLSDPSQVRNTSSLSPSTAFPSLLALACMSCIVMFSPALAPMSKSA